MTELLSRGAHKQVESLERRLAAPVLVIGVGGMLHRAWAEALRGRGAQVVAPSMSELDLTDAAAIRRGLGDEYRLVVNCAAWTDVDGAEKNEEKATAINATGVGELARRCAASGALLVHYSTDYVFDGRANAPYSVDAPRAPLGAYGRSKARGEELLAASGAEHLSVRTSWLYAPWGKNFVRTIARLSRERESLRVVDDQRGRPTSAEHLVATSLALLAAGTRGTAHVTDGGECTWYELACEVVRLTGARCRVEPCTTADYPTLAQRPAYSVLELRATERLVGAMPPWRQALAGVVARLEP